MKWFVSKFLDWYKRSVVQKLFLWACVAALFVWLVSLWFNPGGYLSMAALIIIIFALVLSMLETWQNHRRFSAEIKDLRHRHYARVVANQDKPAETHQVQIFSPEDLRRIKRKESMYGTTFAVKMVFVIFLLALFINLL